MQEFSTSIAATLVGISLLMWLRVLFSRERLRALGYLIDEQDVAADFSAGTYRPTPESALMTVFVFLCAPLLVRGFTPNLSVTDNLGQVCLIQVSIAAVILIGLKIIGPAVPFRSELKAVQILQCSLRVFLLAVLPVAAVLAATHPLRTPDKLHPLLKLISDSPSLPTLSYVFLSAVILAPLVEELVFRVVLQSVLEHHFSVPTGILVSSVVFCAGFHKFPDMLPLFPLAVMLSLAWYRTRSYLVIVLVHAFFNATNLVLMLMQS